MSICSLDSLDYTVWVHLLVSSAIFSKGSDFYDLLFASLDKKLFEKRGNHERKDSAAWSIQGHHLNDLGSILISLAAY